MIRSGSRPGLELELDRNSRSAAEMEPVKNENLTMSSLYAFHRIMLMQQFPGNFVIHQAQKVLY